MDFGEGNARSFQLPPIGLLAAMMFGGLWCWTEYKERIDVARYEKFYSIQYSLQTVYLQFAASSPSEARLCE